jgi:hypothetical protein
MPCERKILHRAIKKMKYSSGILESAWIVIGAFPLIVDQHIGSPVLPLEEKGIPALPQEARR